MPRFSELPMPWLETDPVTDALEYARSLVAVPSVSRDSNGPVSDVVEKHLRALGFQIERQEFLDPHGIPKVNVLGRKGPGGGYFLACRVLRPMQVESRR